MHVWGAEGWRATLRRTLRPGSNALRRETWKSETRLLGTRRMGLGRLIMGLTRVLGRREGPWGNLLTCVSHDECAWLNRLFGRRLSRDSKLECDVVARPTADEVEI